MKRKFILFFLSVLFFLSFLFYPSNKAYAFDCKVTASPSPIPAGASKATLTIDGTGNFGSSQQYNVFINGTAIGPEGGRGRPTAFSSSNGTITVPLSRITFTSGKTYPVQVYIQSTNNPLCTNNPSFTVSADGGSGGGNSCNLVPVKPNPFSPKPSDYIAFKITGNLASGNGDDQLHTYIRLNNNSDNSGGSVWDGCIKRSALIDSNGFGFGYLTSSSYYLQVNDGCTPAHLFENPACAATFYVDPSGGALSGRGSPENPIPPTPCKAGANVSGKCTIVDTALGPIGTDPQSLIKSVFGLILSISGGIALLLIIISGYKILASQGNPETLKGAREQLTAAIVGLLFIIFALVILQIIGYDILRIPGFGASTTQPSNARIGGP